MDENQRFFHFVRKRYEIYTLLFRHYIPTGRPIPDHYRDCLYQDYKVWYNGELEDISLDPPEDHVIQTPIFGKIIDTLSETENGTKVDKNKS